MVIVMVDRSLAIARTAEPRPSFVSVCKSAFSVGRRERESRDLLWWALIPKRVSSQVVVVPYLVWFPDPSTQKIRACAYDACACRKEGSGTELYANAGPGILISVGEPLVLSGC